MGPFTSVYHHCLIEGSEVAGSVVLENTTIRGMERRIEDSLIGRNVRIQGDRCKAPHLSSGTGRLQPGGCALRRALHR